MFTQFCGVLVFLVSKRTGVAVISRLKLALCMSYVSFLLVCVISGNCCLVNHVCCSAFTRERAGIFLSAVAIFVYLTC